MHHHQAPMTDTGQIRAFVSGGHAVFTVVSGKTGNRFTYRVRGTNKAGFFFVDVLTGPENTNDYSFIGSLSLGNFTYWHSRKSGLSADAPSVVAFEWLMERIKYERPLDPETVEFWHSGRCGRCGRDLTDPESIARGLGPTCANRSY